MMSLKKEIRQILLGYISFDGKNITAAEGVFRMRSLGVFNTSGEARIFGISERCQRYAIPKKERDRIAAVSDKALMNIGRRISLQTAPDTPAVLHTSVIFNPSVLTIAYENEKKGTLTVRVYTARTLSSWITSRHTLRVLEKQLPEGFVRLQSEKKERAAEARERREKEKAQKTAKKSAASDEKAGDSEKRKKV